MISSAAMEPRVSITVEQARRQLTQSFREAGLDSPELDARLFVGHALGFDHSALASQSHRVLSASEWETISTLAERRLRHEPVARILGRKEFWGLPLRLNAETLVPRPETETVVEAALAALDQGRGRRHPMHIADLGTGSGALLLALLSELPAAYGIGTDLSLPALDCARRNAVELGLVARAAFVACDYAAALKPPFDLVVANPPYVARADIATLDPEVRLFDPSRALDGGRGGLDAYRAIAGDIGRVLAPHGALVLELGAGQHHAVTKLFGAAGLAAGPVRHDLSGTSRALVVRRLP
jgi:release factor glutamine methyltransferase